MLEQKIELLTAAITALLGEIKGAKITTSGGAAAADAGEKKGRGRPAGSTGKGKTAPAEEEENDDVLGDGDAGDDGLGLGDDDGEPELTQEDIIGAFRALKAAKGVEACKAVLKAVGESNAMNIPPEKFAKTKAEIDKKAKGK